jgi:hypothetical protein
VDFESIKLSSLNSRNEGMPVMIGSVVNGIEEDGAGWKSVVHAIEEQQLDTCGSAGEDGEIGATIEERRP